jgi:hypothetical protein
LVAGGERGRALAVVNVGDTDPDWNCRDRANRILPTIRQPSSGINLECSGEIEIYSAFDSLGISQELPTATDLLVGAEGPVQIKSHWVSGVDGDEKTMPLEPALIRSAVHAPPGFGGSRV